MGRRRKKKERDKRVEMKERNLENIETILLWSITVVLPRIACFYSNPEKLYRLSPIDRSIAADSWNRLRRFKENITSTTMYTDIKRKGTISILRLCFIKERREKKIESKPCLLLFRFILILRWFSFSTRNYNLSCVSFFSFWSSIILRFNRLIN